MSRSSSNFDIIAKLDHVTKAFGEVVAVSDASFSIEKGIITGFLGPNGSGKSTAIKMILGLIKPQKGKVTLFGKNPYYNSSAKQFIGYIPELDAFPKGMKAHDYLVSFGRFLLSKEEANRAELDLRANEVLEEIGLNNFGNKRISQFSKGMKQLIKIGQGIIHKPALVIADEPFNGLDPVVRKKMFDLFNKYVKEYNSTFFISSHILFEMERIAEKVILLYKGRTVAQGTPLRIREMIEDQPHTIQITTRDSNKFSRLLIKNANEEIVSHIKFQKNPRSNEDQLEIVTHKPREFYSLVTALVTESKIPILEIKAVDEGIQNLYKSLTIG
jgi:ABC-2 type transport system ATP-binding protein